MEYRSPAEMAGSMADSVSFGDSGVAVIDEKVFRTRDLDRLAYTAVFGGEDVRALSRWLIWEAAQHLGAVPSSIQSLYEAAAKGALAERTVPACNLRGMTYDMARAAIRAAVQDNVGPVIFEIARSEMGYTQQRPEEYATMILAAALREGHRGPVFIQGDHFQISRSAFAKDPDKEIAAVRALVDEALQAGFYNIDIDASTLVDLSKPTLDEQQELNTRYTAEFTRHIREWQPAGIVVSVGGEIGEIGSQNSTPEELRAFMRGYRRNLGEGVTGISKISVQTGTVHGGVPLPDGTVADVKLDFDRLEELSRIAREEFGLAGAVQHGASTLPEDYFDLFPKKGTAEVHLATGFQNIVFDSAAFPPALRQEIHAYLKANHSDERKAGETDEQFYYKTRKRAWGPFKQQIWNLPAAAKEQIDRELEAQFRKLFRKLGVANSRELVEATIRPVAVHKKRPGS